jgi:hemolysin activation/secretion protein
MSLALQCASSHADGGTQAVADSPPATGQQNPPAASSRDAPAASPQNKPPSKFDVWEIDVDGNTVLDAETIERVVSPFVGPDRSFADVDQARDALETLYRDRGYKTVSVEIPRQTVRDGVVLLTVTESHVGHLNVVGSQYHSLEQIKTEAPSLAEGTVPEFKQVQKDIVALNQQPDSRVTPALKAGATPGTVDVDLVVDDHLPVHGNAELNNRRSEDTSELRASASLSYGNLWQLGHSLSLSYQTAPEKPSDARVLYLSYLARFGTSPFNLLINALDSDSNVATFGGTDIIGNGRMLGVRGIYQLPSGNGLYPSITFGVDYKHFKTVTALGSSSFDTPVDYFPFTLGYDVSSHIDKSTVQSDLTLTFASPRLGSDTQTIQLNRAFARGQMLSLRSNVAITEDLSHDLQSYVRLTGQLTDQPLISNEQISAGGMETVRGYLEAETLGDLGASGTLELRSPPLGDYITLGKANQPVQEFRFFGFADGAILALRNPLPGQDYQYRLASLGLGFNFKAFNYVNGAFDWADPMITQSATRAWSSRLLFRVWTSF